MVSEEDAVSLFSRTIKYRLKTLYKGAYGLACLALALIVAACPFIGLIIPDALVPIGWIDRDKTKFSERLLDNVNALEVVWVMHGDEETLIANLQTGRLEAVFVVKEGFEEAMENGQYEGTLLMLRSPFSTAAGVISESVGGEAMNLWVTCAAAKEGGNLGGGELYKQVFEYVELGTEMPILNIERRNEVGQMQETTPLLDAAKMSLRLLAAVAGFFMLTGLIMPRREKDFYSRLKTRSCSKEKFLFSSIIADAAYMLPCAAVPLAAFAVSGEGRLIIPLLLLFALYLISLGGIAAMIAKLREHTSQLMLISLLTIANVMLGGLLMPLPSSGALDIIAHLLPARWLSSTQIHGILLCIAGLGVSAIVYNALPFIIRSRD